MNAISLSAMEMIDIQLALKDAIQECDKVIEECQKNYINPCIWIDKKANLINGLSKLEKRYYNCDL